MGREPLGHRRATLAAGHAGRTSIGDDRLLHGWEQEDVLDLAHMDRTGRVGHIALAVSNAGASTTLDRSRETPNEGYP